MPDFLEGHLNQLDLLPLPSAALVLDVRGVKDDNVIERLKVEITDLASEMQAHDINHWRNLTSFLSFRVVEPLPANHIAALKRQRTKGQSETARGEEDEPESANRGQFLWGDTDPEAPFDIFKQSLIELQRETDRVRHNRVYAFQDISRSGKVGQIRRDPTVRVMFITDANNSHSLATAAIYAAHLKEHFQQRERPGQSLVNISVLCLDNRTEADAAEQLIEHLCWEGGWQHLDSLIINEQYNSEGALLNGPIQTYLAELILYTLLLIPPLDLPGGPVGSGSEQRDAQTGQKGEQGSRTRTLPSATFHVGMATIEHSARWGHRWLNYSLATSMLEILLHKAGESPQEIRQVRISMKQWFAGWRAQIAMAIPDKLPANIPGLKAIGNAERSAAGPEEVFADQRLGWRMPQNSVHDLRTHHRRLLAHYVRNTTRTAEAAVSLPDAIESLPVIEQRLKEWEERDPAFKKGMPLVSAQSEAQNVLGRNLTMSRGAIPRAREQLMGLSIAIAEFQSAREEEKLDVQEKHQKLEQEGRDLLTDLENQAHHFPFLASVWRWRRGMAVATMVLLVLFFLVLLLLGLGVTADIVQSNHITWPLLSGIPALLDFGSFQSNLFWFIALVVDIAAVVPARRATLRDSYGALRTEGVLLLLMALICISALVCGFGLPGLLRSDTSGQLVWLTSVVSLGVVLGIAALVMLVLEVFYYTRWQHNFLEARERGLERLNREHLRNTEAVKTFISDTIAVQLLMRTGLLGADGGPGPYYNHIALLNNHLRNILDRTSKQQRLAAQRLGSNMNSAQPVSRNRAAGEWLRLRIREEFLDIPVLVDGYKRWQSILEKDSDQVKHFTELLLRMMGQEVPAQVEQQFREHAPLNNYEQHQARILLEVLVSIILRFTMAPESLGSLTGVYERYETLKDGYLRALPVVGVLLQTLDEQISQVAINPMAESGSESPRVRTEDRLQLATEAFATWGQVLWDHQDNRLDRCLTRQGVLAKMMDDPDYEPLGLMRQIGLRVALFANSLQVGQRGDAYLMLSPSDQSRRFRQSLSIDTTGIRVTEFPDNERLILFYIQRYGGPPQRLGIGAGPASTQSSGRGDMASLATATAGVSASAIVMPVNDDESIPAPLDESVIDGASASPTA